LWFRGVFCIFAQKVVFFFFFFGYFFLNLRSRGWGRGYGTPL